MTDRARKILNGKRKRVLQALEDERRFTEDGLFILRDDEVKTLLKWLKELTKGENHADIANKEEMV
jgi:hypothetical protein